MKPSSLLPSTLKIIEGYSKSAKEYFSRYESVSFHEVHEDIYPYLPKIGSCCLDVGAGSGRDAAALNSLGFKVTAVEPATMLLNLAKIAHSRSEIKWVEDSLPNLLHVKALKKKYPLILVCAVWMHIPKEYREMAFNTLHELLADDGVLIITIRLGREDPYNGFFPIESNEICKLSLHKGLKCIELNNSSKDVFKRIDISWKKFIIKNN